MREIDAAALTTDAARVAFARGVALGLAAGIVCGVAFTLALTQPVEDVVRLLRDRLLNDSHGPQFELLN